MLGTDDASGANPRPSHRFKEMDRPNDQPNTQGEYGVVVLVTRHVDVGEADDPKALMPVPREIRQDLPKLADYVSRVAGPHLLMELAQAIHEAGSEATRP